MLLVEDHGAFAQAMRMVMRSAGDMEVAGIAGTFAEGREMALRGERWDLVVVDLMLPDGSGVDLVSKIKSEDPNTPVAVLSAENDLSAALEAGADEAIRKETPLPEIVSILHRLAHR